MRVASYGTPEGVPFTKDDAGNIYVHSNQGLCSFFPFENLTEEKVSLPAGNQCYTEFIENDGFKKILVLTDAQGQADNSLGV